MISRSSSPEVFLGKALQLYSNRTSTWVFSCKFAAYFQNTFFLEHFWTAASGYTCSSHTVSNVLKLGLFYQILKTKYSSVKSVVQPYIMEKYSQDTLPEFFVEISNLYCELENENGNEDIRGYHHYLGKTITCLYILSDRFRSSFNETAELIDQLYI